MKKIMLLLFLLAGNVFAYSQKVPYRVVFDLTSKDPANYTTVLRQIKGIIQERPDAQLEVAMYSDGIEMVCKENAAFAKEIEELINEKKATFKVCAFTLKRKNIDQSELLPGVTVVPDAIYEIVTRQHEGWGYIKVAQ
ncbi:DsrE family protein [Chitinophaga sp.]|uniref:DsrE family protein n=1 Tax=Chitinophaga sp. TaxID=1869181 RepID=UPI0031D84981